MNDFLILKKKMNDRRLVYLDSASTSQKPRQVLAAMQDFYENDNANIHRGVYPLSERATEQYEKAHEIVAGFIQSEKDEIIFTRNTTESINLVAYAYALKNLIPGDNIVTTIMEHHSNFVPWQQICREKGAELRIIDIDNEGNLKNDGISSLIDKRTKLVAITHTSNVLGTINNIQHIADIAHDNESKILIDGAQSVPHMPVSIKRLKCDFLAFSGHKMLGPTGIGVLFAKKEILRTMQPFMFGGDMIRKVTKENTTWNDLPWKFEAGTPNIAGGIGLAAAVKYLRKKGMDNIMVHEKNLLRYAAGRLSDIKNTAIYGAAENKAGILSFNLKGIHAHDVATIAAQEGVCIRAGHHCCQPLMNHLGVPATARASFYLYNTKQDCDVLLGAIEKAQKVFA